MQSESKQTRASLKLVFTLSLMMGLSQGCSNFNAGDLANSGQSAPSARQLAIQSDQSAPAINQQILFNPMGVSFSTQAVYAWTHTLSDSTTGAVLTPCIELSGSSLGTYPLKCTQTGTLQVQLTVSDGAVVFGPVSMTQVILAAAVNPPSPTPPPAGPNAAGVQLYQTSCAGCHGSLANNNIRSKTVSALSSAISNVGSMRGLSLNSTQEQEIVNALNGM